MILGAAEILTVKLSEQPALLATANRIKRTAIDTTEQVTALLMLSRAPEELDIANIEVCDFVQEQITQCEPLLHGKPVVFEFVIKGKGTIASSPALAAIVLRNILRNACQHTDEGLITITLFENKIVIEDTGCGIDKENQEFLFQRTNSKSQTGYGFGLSIVRRIADHLGWTVRFEPVAEGGSRFIVHFADAETEKNG